MAGDEDVSTPWITGEVARGYLDLTSIKVEVFAQVVEATRDFVEERRPDRRNDAGVFEPTSSIMLGTAMLAHRLYARRLTPVGIIGGGEDNPAGILREDPDVARLLGIGRARKFSVGGTGPRAVV